ncbi:MAG: Betaine reductase component B alpha subunit [Firmicutes bacterium]|nr:Betaine reductase component B alpha subunit [Bacillota bacterium]MDI6706570.1 glycine/sarcosine/betaine reductase component B subunit [Bacillota bacterium]
MRLTRQYFTVKDVVWDDSTKYEDGLLSINEQDLQNIVNSIAKSVGNIRFDIVKPGENKRIIHALDAIQPMWKVEGAGRCYSGFFSRPSTVGDGVTNILNGFAVIESAPLPWDSTSASSGLLYPRDAIIDMIGPASGMSPFSDTMNLVMSYDLIEGKSSQEYDNDIRLCALKVSEFLAKLTADKTPGYSEEFCIDDVNPSLPNVILVWQCQNQGVYANTYLYGHSIDNLVPTVLHPNEMLDGCIVSGNYVWPAFKVPTYLHVNHPILLELYRKHGSELNLKGVVFSRSHNPTNWHKERSANFCAKLAEYLKAEGLIMAWEGGGNAAVDGMLTIQAAERKGIKATAITFEFGGKDGTEGDLLVDHVPEADAIVSGGSIEKEITLPEVEEVIGGSFLRLNKESGGFFPPAGGRITFDTNTQIYCAGNQAGHSRLCGEAY